MPRGGGRYIFIYSITSRSSFEVAKAIHEKLLQSLGVNSLSSCILVGNKLDLAGSRYPYSYLRHHPTHTCSVCPLLIRHACARACVGVGSRRVRIRGWRTGVPRHRREVPEPEGRALAAAWGCSFLEISAKHDDNVARGFQQLLTQARRAAKGCRPLCAAGVCDIFSGWVAVGGVILSPGGSQVQRAEGDEPEARHPRARTRVPQQGAHVRARRRCTRARCSACSAGRHRGRWMRGRGLRMCVCVCVGGGGGRRIDHVFVQLRTVVASMLAVVVGVGTAAFGVYALIILGTV